MPKIEIELSELEQIRSEAQRSELMCYELENMLNKFQAETNVEDLRKKAIELSWKLSEKYLVAIFNKLGFTNELPTEQKYWTSSPIQAGCNFRTMGEDWYKKVDEFEVNISAQLEDKVRKAFISIGVITNPEKNKEKLLELI